MKFRKVIAGVLVGLMATSVMAVSASAGSIDRTYNGQFNSAWSLAATEGSANLTYGYNTVAINEDFAWANHNSMTHFASLTNSRNVYNGSKESAGNTSKVEVTHSGNSVEYHCYW